MVSIRARSVRRMASFSLKIDEVTHVFTPDLLDRPQKVKCTETSPVTSQGAAASDSDSCNISDLRHHRQGIQASNMIINLNNSPFGP